MKEYVKSWSGTTKTVYMLFISLLIIGVLVSCNRATLKQVAIQFPKATIATKDNDTKDAPKKRTVLTTENPWYDFDEDGLHDPENPAFDLLQRPAEALDPFPRNKFGNKINWVSAITDGHINPRTNIFPETKVNILDLDIFLSINGSLPIVRFPHRAHTLWLDCANCHDKIFTMEAGGNKFTMADILEGNACGQCHGAVAFPLSDCNRCHSVPHEKFKEILAQTKNKACGKLKGVDKVC